MGMPNEINEEYKFIPFIPPVSFEDAGNRAEEILSGMTLEEKIQLAGGDNLFYIKGFKKK